MNVAANKARRLSSFDPNTHTVRSRKRKSQRFAVHDKNSYNIREPSFSGR